MVKALREAVICEPLRTAVGAFGGVYRDTPAEELGAHVVRELIRRTGVDPSGIDDVLFAQCYPSMDAPALGRVVALDAGLPVTVGGMQLDRRCGSGVQAIVNACMQVATGVSDRVVAGGTESMSRAPFFTHRARWGVRDGSLTFDDSLARGRVTAGGALHPVPGGMIDTAENLRAEFAISREEQDAFACRSHERAVAAHESGNFTDEIVPFSARAGRGEQIVVDRDEHPRPGVSIASLARLKPLRIAVDPLATVTAGNASGQNDGASACLVTTREEADRLGVKAFARIVSWAVAGVEPSRMGIGPVPSTERALARAGLSLADIDLIELNEAFAAQALAVTKAWGFGEKDHDRLNVNGSGISLGHPVGATGGRILATLLHEMDRRQARFGLETMCIGGGQGITAVFERVEG